MKLTQKQEAFCVAYIAEGNASKAYRSAYAASKMKDESVRVNAAKLMADTNIALRIQELRKPAAEAAQVTLSQHLVDLQRIRDAAFNEGKFAAAATAEMARGKVSGLYVERVEHSGSLSLEAALAKSYEVADGTDGK